MNAPASKLKQIGLSLGLFLLALIPRGIALQRFVTADEAKWVYRSAQFLLAFWRGDFAATAVNLTPAVSTTWLGSLGLAIYYLFHRSELALSFTEWLVVRPPFRVDLSILIATRWSMVILAAVSTVIIYLLAKRLWRAQIAFVAAILIALDPHTIALTRIIGHDGPAAIFMTLSILSLLIAWPGSASRPSGRWMVVSGVTAGLAFLSKSPALFLIPFAGLFVFVRGWRSGFLFWQGFAWLSRSKFTVGGHPYARPQRHRDASATKKLDLLWLALWGAVAYAVFIILWPAAWTAPVKQPFAIVENAFFSATDLDERAEEADEETEYQQVPRLGAFYYLVNGAFKLSPLVTIGLLVGIGRSIGRISNRPLRLRQMLAKTNLKTWLERDDVWLILFVILFTIFMTLGSKRSNRYLLPIFPALAILAAVGWSGLSLGRWRWWSAEILSGGMILLGLVALLPYAPYYYTYFNPLLGGPLTAPRLVKIGWGEGMDQVGVWLNQQPDAATNAVGSYYASTLDPYFDGRVLSPASNNLDYVVLYIKQRQDGLPLPIIQGYYNQIVEPVKTIQLAGIDYARIYPGPAVRPAETPGQVLAFKPQTNFAPIGEEFATDLIWLASPGAAPITVTLSLRQGDTVRAEGDVFSSIFNPGLTVHRHTLSLPADIPPGSYTLFANEQRLGQLEARYGQIPTHFSPVEVGFGDQIQLVGFNPELTPINGQLSIELAFKATPKAWADYTVFVHLIDAAGERLTGHDAQPTPPTSRWLKGAVVLDSHTLTLPFDLPPNQIYHIRVGLYESGTGEGLGESYELPVEISN